MLCLSMIVRNEAPVIRRCLDSVKELIDHWVIVDTGSTDGTQDIVRSAMEGIPGHVVEFPWVDFSSNRNVALAAAKAAGADYVLVIDADDVLEVPDEYSGVPLEADIYDIRVVHGDIVHYRPHVFRTDIGCEYRGVVHEGLYCDRPTSRATLAGVTYRVIGGGARSSVSDREKFLADVALLETAPPSDTRAAFYLAQSYRDAGETAKAYDAYVRRSAMEGWSEEVYMSLLYAGRLGSFLAKPEDVVVGHWLRAYEVNPARAEALFELAQHYHRKQQWHRGLLFSARALENAEPPPGALFSEPAVYDWMVPDAYAICASWLGHKEDAALVNQDLIASPKTPIEQKPRLLQNLGYCK